MTTPFEDAPDPRLGRLRPATVGLDSARDRLLFEAGRASGRLQGRRVGLIWAAAAGLVVALGLGIPLARDRGRIASLEIALADRTREPVAPPPPSNPGRTLPPIAPDSYLALSRQLLAGLDPPAVPHRPNTSPTSDRPTLSPRMGREMGAILDL